MRGPDDLLPIQLGKAIHKTGQPFRCRMLLTIPCHMVGWRAQAKVGREVDDSRRQCTELFHVLRRLTVGQGHEQQIAGLQHRDRIELERRSPTQIRMARMHKTPRSAFRGHLTDLYMGVIQQKPQHLAPGIARSADDRYTSLAHHPFLPTCSAYSTTFAGISTPVVSMLLRNSIV